VLWQAGAWREELIQLLKLLAERADRRLHPLPRPSPWRRSAGGWNGRSRRRGCQAVAWHSSGVGGLRGDAGCYDQIVAFSIRMKTSLAERISMLR
jgi:hypothetical protein